MPDFLYKAVERNGRLDQGSIAAHTRPEALQLLERKGLQVVSLKNSAAANVSVSASSRPSESSRQSALLSREQIILFTEELSDLLEAGLQLEPALRSMETRQELGGLKEIVMRLRERITEGTAFSVALRDSRAGFGELYCNIVAAGELSGSLPKLLRSQVTYLQTIDELQHRVVQSFIYPSFIFVAGLVLITVFMTYLVPQLTRLLRESGKSLPLATRILIDFSNFMAAYGLWILGFLILLGCLAAAAIQRPEGRMAWDRMKLRLPVVGPVLTARIYAQFSQTLANLVANGIPLLTGLQLSHRAAENVYFAHLLDQILNLVGDGGSFARALRSVGHFPPLFIDIVAVGEQTGDLAASLEKASNRYDKELSRRIQRMTSLIQPLIIVVMALLVGMVAYSMITGIFQTITGLKAH